MQNAAFVPGNNITFNDLFILSYDSMTVCKL